ncbi:MAG TPA: acetyl-CoA carboxylase biotin carboxyl carrier protein [Candidatus Brocadiia bacterium]|nr:acetyl-CoA carboxylase biotin carboxyl carrier protein [Candidatus Brocadiia bacterium]
MDPLDRVRQLIEIMKENDLVEIEVEEPDLKVRLKRAEAPAKPSEERGQPLQLPDAGGKRLLEGQELVEIASPMVGTFYRSSSPSGKPFVEEGSIVEPDTLVCIIEAMKVMNEIRAEVRGEVVRALADNASPVEFGQALFLVRPLPG